MAHSKYNSIVKDYHRVFILFANNTEYPIHRIFGRRDSDNKEHHLALFELFPYSFDRFYIHLVLLSLCSVLSFF